jgi:hypothetical protein
VTFAVFVSPKIHAQIISFCFVLRHTTVDCGEVEGEAWIVKESERNRSGVWGVWRNLNWGWELRSWLICTHPLPPLSFSLFLSLSLSLSLSIYLSLSLFVTDSRFVTKEIQRRPTSLNWQRMFRVLSGSVRPMRTRVLQAGRRVDDRSTTSWPNCSLVSTMRWEGQGGLLDGTVVHSRRETSSSSSGSSRGSLMWTMGMIGDGGRQRRFLASTTGGDEARSAVLATSRAVEATAAAARGDKAPPNGTSNRSAAATETRKAELQARLKKARDELVELKGKEKDAEDRVKNIDAELAQLKSMEQTAGVLAQAADLRHEKSTLNERINGLSLQVIPKAEAKIEKLEKDIETLESGIGNYFTCI